MGDLLCQTLHGQVSWYRCTAGCSVHTPVRLQQLILRAVPSCEAQEHVVHLAVAVTPSIFAVCQHTQRSFDSYQPCGRQVLDYERDGDHAFIGECQTSLAQLKQLAATQSQTLELINPKKMGQRGYRHSGGLTVREATITPRPSFLQYIKGGWGVA